MRRLYFAAGLLWIALTVLLFALATALTQPQSLLHTTLFAALAIPVALRLRSTHRQLREMTANRMVLREDGIEVMLSGSAREWKGLPDVPQTLVPWSAVLSLVSEKKSFVYPSRIPLEYSLEVFTVYSKTGGISFTRECIPNAKMVASQISARIAG